MFELEKKAHAVVAKLASAGDSEGEKGNWDGLISKYSEAWDKIPEPKYEWEGGTWILGGIAEAYFQKGEAAQALKIYEECLKCYRGNEDSTILFRIGQLYYDRASFTKARKFLKKAWELSEGREFIDEPKRYREFLFKPK